MYGEGPSRSFDGVACTLDGVGTMSAIITWLWCRFSLARDIFSPQQPQKTIFAVADCNALAGVKAKRWRLGSQSGVGRVTS